MHRGCSLFFCFFQGSGRPRTAADDADGVPPFLFPLPAWCLICLAFSPFGVPSRRGVAAELRGWQRVAGLAVEPRLRWCVRMRGSRLAGRASRTSPCRSQGGRPIGDQPPVLLARTGTAQGPFTCTASTTRRLSPRAPRCSNTRQRGGVDKRRGGRATVPVAMLASGERCPRSAHGSHVY